MLFAFRWLFSLNESARTAPGTIMIQPRASKHVYEYMLMFMASIAMAYGCTVFSSGRTGAHWWLIGGAAVAIISGIIANPHLWLDDQAMHYRLARFPTVSIPWAGLDHYEKNRVVSRGGSSIYYYFRSRDGKTIALSQSTYDTDSLLEKIRVHGYVSEKPYKP